METQIKTPPASPALRIPDLSRIEVVDRRSADLMRKLTEMERLQRACAMGDQVRARVRHYIKTMHPEWSEEQIFAEMLRRAGHAKSR